MATFKKGKKDGRQTRKDGMVGPRVQRPGGSADVRGGQIKQGEREDRKMGREVKWAKPKGYEDPDVVRAASDKLQRGKYSPTGTVIISTNRIHPDVVKVIWGDTVSSLGFLGKMCSHK